MLLRILCTCIIKNKKILSLPGGYEWHKVQRSLWNKQMKILITLLLLIPSLAWNVSKAGYEPSNEHKEKELREYCRVIHSEIEYSIRNYVND